MFFAMGHHTRHVKYAYVVPESNRVLPPAWRLNSNPTLRILMGWPLAKTWDTWTLRTKVPVSSAEVRKGGPNIGTHKEACMLARMLPFRICLSIEREI